MEKEDIERRLNVTRGQIATLEGSLLQAESRKVTMQPRIYDAMIDGLKGQMQSLKEEARSYEEQLKQYSPIE